MHFESYKWSLDDLKEAFIALLIVASITDFMVGYVKLIIWLTSQFH